MRLTVYLLCAITLALVNSYAMAQDDLSLSDAISLGLERNFDIQIEKENIAIAERNNNWGEAGRYPSLTFNFTPSHSINDNIKVFNPFSPRGKTVATGLSPDVRLNWTVFNGFKIKMSKYRLEKLQEESQGNADIVIANNIQSIILGYYSTVLEKERLDEFQKQLKLSGDKYNYVKIKKELGSAVSTELLLEEGNYLTDSTNYINQQLVYRNALRNLNFLIGEDNPDRTYNLTNGLDFEVIDYDFEDLVTKMNGKNVDLQKQYLSQSILKYDVEINKADRYPTLTLGANYTYNRTNVNVGDLDELFRTDPVTNEVFDSRTTASANYGANFTLTFNLFNGGRINRAIKNAVAREDIGNIRLDRLKNSLRRDLALNFDQYNIRKQLYGINERRYQAAETNLSISEEKFKNGTINSFDYRTVQNNYLNAATQRLQSLYNLIDANVSLLRLTGGIIETYKN
ncbi:MAG: TolC family protein [Bacteroidota bacterium]